MRALELSKLSSEIKPLIVGTSALQPPFTELCLQAKFQFEGRSQAVT